MCWDVVSSCLDYDHFQQMSLYVMYRLESSWKYIVLKWTQLARRVCHSKIDKCELPYWNSGFVSVEWGGAQLTFCSFSPLLVLTPGSLCATYVALLGEIICAVEFLIYYISILSQSFMKHSYNLHCNIIIGTNYRG